MKLVTSSSKSWKQQSDLKRKDQGNFQNLAVPKNQKRQDQRQDSKQDQMTGKLPTNVWYNEKNRFKSSKIWK